MEFHKSLRTLVILFWALIFSFSSCKLLHQRVKNDFYRVDQSTFAEIQLRFGEGSNEFCVLHLTKEGVLGRASNSFYSGDNKYFFRAMNTIDSSSITRIQEIVVNAGYFVSADSCYCNEGSSLVPPRITYISNPETNCSKVICDRNFSNEHRSSEKALDDLWHAMELLIPENFKNAYCWE